MVFTYTFIDFIRQDYVTVIYHIDILGWTILSDNKCACLSLIPRQSGAHETFWNCDSDIFALKQYFCEVAISPFSGADGVSLCARNTTYQNNSLACRENMDEGENRYMHLP